MPISLRSRKPATATRSSSISASPLRRPSSPTSSTTSTTPTSTFRQSRERLHGSVLKTRGYDNERTCEYCTQSACRCLTQVQPARRRSRLPSGPRIDGDHVFLLRLPEVVGL